ncbi:MAG: hypothetical protein UR26_C0002G0127 [candidate division TM6 bacterium GW2011_GWF2_32_72]|nr:MAG: hypothetical protein UR26_C0002G0127 [candidate division TM6 bacterium GW2011_GWF2_32_72]
MVRQIFFIFILGMSVESFAERQINLRSGKMVSFISFSNRKQIWNNVVARIFGCVDGNEYLMLEKAKYIRGHFIVNLIWSSIDPFKEAYASITKIKIQDIGQDEDTLLAQLIEQINISDLAIWWKEKVGTNNDGTLSIIIRESLF